MEHEAEEAAEEGGYPHTDTHHLKVMKKKFTDQFVFAPAEFVETNEQIQDEPTGKHVNQ